MGRPPIRKSGAYTGAERTRRYRKKLKRAELAARAAETEARHRRESHPPMVVYHWKDLLSDLMPAKPRDWLILKPLPETVERLANELAAQLMQAMHDFPGVTLDDVLHALNRWR
jgi:hypothetical protein